MSMFISKSYLFSCPHIDGGGERVWPDDQAERLGAEELGDGGEEGDKLEHAGVGDDGISECLG